MKVILEASDIRQALTEYAANNLPFSSDDSLDIILDDDMTVEISVGGSVDKPEPKSSTTKRKGRPKKKTQESKQDSTEEKDTSLNEDTTGAFDESTSTSSSEPEDKEQAEEPKSLFAGFAKTSNG